MEGEGVSCGRVNTFTMYRSYFESASDMPPRTRGAYLDAICRYMFTDENPEDGLSKDALRAFKMVKPHLDHSIAQGEKARRAAPLSDARTDDSEPEPGEYPSSTRGVLEQNRRSEAQEPNQSQTQYKNKESTLNPKARRGSGMVGDVARAFMGEAKIEY